MKKIILIYGLISGAVSATLMVIMALSLRQSYNFDHGEIYGYSGMVLSLLFVYLGVRAYREQVLGGAITFGQAIAAGSLIALISCICYALAWEVVYPTLLPDFLEKYAQCSMDKLKASGASEASLEENRNLMLHYKAMYQNPLTRFGLTFMEPLIPAVLATLISAVVLRKKEGVSLKTVKVG